MKTGGTSAPILFFYFTLQALMAQRISVLPEVIGYLGHDVTLPCAFISEDVEDTVSQVQWNLLGQKVPILIVDKEFGLNKPKSPLMEKVELDQESLVIRNVEMTNEGVYQCILIPFPYGGFYGMTTLVVRATAPVSNVKVTPSTGSSDLLEFMSSVSLSCSSSGSSLSFVWMNGSLEMTTGDRVQLTDGNSNLTIVNVTRYDQGPFRCNVSNSLNIVTSKSVHLIIQYGPDNVTIVGPESAPSGTFTMLYCSTESVPPAQFTWLFEGRPTEAREAVFVIRSSQTSHSGTYTCTAENTVTGTNQTVHHRLTVTDSSDCDCAAAAIGASIITAVCMIVSVAVCGIIVCVVVRKKKSA